MAILDRQESTLLIATQIPEWPPLYLSDAGLTFSKSRFHALDASASTIAQFLTLSRQFQEHYFEDYRKPQVQIGWDRLKKVSQLDGSHRLSLSWEATTGRKHAVLDCDGAKGAEQVLGICRRFCDLSESTVKGSRIAIVSILALIATLGAIFAAVQMRAWEWLRMPFPIVASVWLAFLVFRVVWVWRNPGFTKVYTRSRAGL